MNLLNELFNLESRAGGDLLLQQVDDRLRRSARRLRVEVVDHPQAAGAQHVIFGVFNDAAVAAKAHELGEGAIFPASFNSQEHQEFSLPFDCEAKVIKLSDGKYVGRRGVLKNVSSDMGPSALLDLGGIQLVVISNRCQCMDPMQFEMFGLDIAQARVVVVTSAAVLTSSSIPVRSTKSTVRA